MNALLEQVDDVRGSAICFIVDCSRETPRLIVASAAHPKIMVFRKGKTDSLPQGDQEGFQIGVGHQMYYDNLVDESNFDLLSGDVLVAVTDGVIEAGAGGEMGPFGTDRMSAIVQQKRNEGSDVIAAAIREAMLNHCGSVLSDDYTILVLQIDECNKLC